MSDRFDDEPAICHCQKRGIGPHWHRPTDVPGEVIEPLCPPEPASVPFRTAPIRESLNTLRLLEALRRRVAGFTTETENTVPPFDDEQDVIDAVTDLAREQVVLNPDDPFEAVLVDIVRTNRRKRQDYAEDGSPFSNFDYTADALGLEGFSAVESAVFNINQKIARLRSLRKNGRINDPANEAVEDTYLDLAVYAVIAYAIHRYPEGKVA